MDPPDLVDLVAVCAGASPGGSQRALLDVVKRLPGHGVRPTVLLLEHGPFEPILEDAGCSVVVIEAGRGRQIHRAAWTIGRLARELRRRPGCVVLGNQTKSHVYSGAAARLARRPALWWHHGYPNDHRIERTARRLPAAEVWCVNQAAANEQHRLAPRWPVRVVTPGVDLDAVRREASARPSARQELGIRPDVPVVGIVGRLQPWKGQHTFLRAAARIAQREPRAQFLVVGGAILAWQDDEAARLRQLATDLGILNRVTFTGHQPDPARWMAACDVVVHASEDEPFGLVIVEALALGKAVVATRGPGPDLILGLGDAGVLVEFGDDAAIATRVLEVLNDKELRGRWEAAAGSVADRYSVAVTARCVAAVVRSIAQRGRAYSAQSAGPPRR